MKPLKLLGAIYAQDKIDAKAAELARIDALQDKGARMLGYQEILNQSSDDQLKWPIRPILKSVLGTGLGFVGLAIVLTIIPVTAPLATAVLATGVVIMGAAASLGLGLDTAYTVSGQEQFYKGIRTRLTEEEASATLENLGPSPQLANVLRDFPGLKARFQEAVLHKAIQNGGDMTPVMRLALQK